MGLVPATLRVSRTLLRRTASLWTKAASAEAGDLVREEPLPRPARERATGPRPGTELEVVAQILRHVSDLEPTLGPIRHMASEVRTHGTSRADILLLAHDLVSVEAKLTDWRRALGQAALNLTVVNRSYVAMWAGHISTALISQAEQHGIGVIEVHPDGLEIVVKAEPGSPDPAARARVLERLEAGVMPPERSP